jgi:adenine-specific DNA methylase
MKFKSDESVEKLRGGYYTPLYLAKIMVDWVLDGKPSNILEPSCGDGIFFQALLSQLEKIQLSTIVSITGVELIESELAKVQSFAGELAQYNITQTLINQEFFTWINNDNDERWDAIIGNPPYIRYQYFEDFQRDEAEKLFEFANVPFSKRTNAWVPFVIASIMHLNPGGRLALVLPKELFHIIHAQGLRLLLEQEMSHIIIVDIKELIFDALQGVIVLFAEKRRDRGFQPLVSDSEKNEDSASIRVHYVEDINNFSTALQKNGRFNKYSDFHGKWLLGALQPEELNLLRNLRENKLVQSFIDVADVTVGIVTGANKYFVVDKETLDKFNLHDIAIPMLARSNFMQGLVYTLDDHQWNSDKGCPVHFLNFPIVDRNELPENYLQYIEVGEKQNLHKRYKTRIRDPWYCVPYLWVSEISMLKRAHDYPRLVLNEAGAFSTDTAYRIRMNDEHSGREKDFVFSFLNSLTLLTTELEGRHYGGGVLELSKSVKFSL